MARLFVMCTNRCTKRRKHAPAHQPNSRLFSPHRRGWAFAHVDSTTLRLTAEIPATFQTSPYYGIRNNTALRLHLLRWLRLLLYAVHGQPRNGSDLSVEKGSRNNRASWPERSRNHLRTFCHRGKAPPLQEDVLRIVRVSIAGAAQRRHSL